MVHTVKGFSVVSEVDLFLEFPCFPQGRLLTTGPPGDPLSQYSYDACIYSDCCGFTEWSSDLAEEFSQHPMPLVPDYGWRFILLYRRR